MDTKQGVCRLPRRKEEGGRGEEEGTEERACRAVEERAALLGHTQLPLPPCGVPLTPS